MVRCTALTKVVGAISQYVRTQKSQGKSIAILRVSNLFRRYCARIRKEPSVLPDDGTIYLLSIGYCKVGIDFLVQLWTTAKISPLPWNVAIVALLYLQRRGIEINGTRILGADALLRARLPEAHTILILRRQECIRFGQKHDPTCCTRSTFYTPRKRSGLKFFDWLMSGSLMSHNFKTIDFTVIFATNVFVPAIFRQYLS